LVDTCGYELPTNLQNFTQKDLKGVKNIQKKVLGSYFFSETRTLYALLFNEAGLIFKM